MPKDDTASVASPKFVTLDWIAIAALLSLVACLSWQFASAIIDDGYIYLRVADNILQGRGWVFNPGDRVNPCTSSPYTILVVLLRLVFSSPVATLLTAYTLGVIALCGIQYFALRSEGRALAFAVAVASVCEPVLFHSVGMETTLFLTCVLGAAWAYQKDAQVVCGGLCALAAMNRPEGLALIVGISALHAIWKRQSLKTAQLAFLAVLVPWLCFSRLYFGSFVSNSISAKAAQVQLGLLNFHMSWGGMLLHRMWIPPATILLAIAGAIVAIFKLRKTNSFPAIVILFGFVHTITYTVLQAPFNYRWYYAPTNLSINMAGLLAIFWILEKIRTRIKTDSSARDWLWPTTSLVAGLLLISRMGAMPFEVPEPYVSDEYVTVGKWIRSHSLETDRVACVEIGYLGYVTQRPIVDVYGLIHPQALSSIWNLELTWWFDSENPPEFVVRHRSPWPGEPGPNWGPLWSIFLKKYRAAIRIGTVVVFHRVE